MPSTTCSECFLGRHLECSKMVDGFCCCGGLADPDEFYGDEQFEHEKARSVAIRMMNAGIDAPSDPVSRKTPTLETVTAEKVDRIESTGKIRGDSGYIAPAAWPSTFNIGELRSVKSAGHKRPRRMYPIKGGLACEWAGLDNCGGGPVPILGCLNNPATDWHHGPDKNTLNNEKASCGIGDSENVHRICSECHNAWHAANDALYPRAGKEPGEYDRDRDQAAPFIPLPGSDWTGHAPMPADLEKLMEQERARAQQRIDRGREHRGRQLKDEDPDLSIGDDDEGDDNDE